MLIAGMHAEFNDISQETLTKLADHSAAANQRLDELASSIAAKIDRLNQKAVLAEAEVLMRTHEIAESLAVLEADLNQQAHEYTVITDELGYEAQVAAGWTREHIFAHYEAVVYPGWVSADHWLNQLFSTGIAFRNEYSSNFSLATVAMYTTPYGPIADGIAFYAYGETVDWSDYWSNHWDQFMADDEIGFASRGFVAVGAGLLTMACLAVGLPVGIGAKVAWGLAALGSADTIRAGATQIATRDETYSFRHHGIRWSLQQLFDLDDETALAYATYGELGLDAAQLGFGILRAAPTLLTKLKNLRNGVRLTTVANDAAKTFRRPPSALDGARPAGNLPQAAKGVDGKPPVVGPVRPYDEATKARIPGYDNHHLDPKLGRVDPDYPKGPTIGVRNDNAGGRVPGGVNLHTGKGGFQTALNEHIKNDLGFTIVQWNDLPNEVRKLHLRRYYASLGIDFPN